MENQNSDNQELQEQETEGLSARQEQYASTLTKQFASLPMAIFIDQKEGILTHMDVCLYCYLLTVQQKKDFSYWSVESLARLTGISGTGVKTSLRRLAKCGHIRRKRTQSTTHTACLTKVESDRRETWIRVKGEKRATFPRKQLPTRQGYSERE